MRKLAVLLLLLVLPLQGFAASLSHLSCAPPAASEAAAGGHQHDSGDAHHGQDAGHGPDDGANLGQSDHFACHQILSGILSFSTAVLPKRSTAFVPADPHSPVPFFPEQPQPVPLA